MTAILPISVSVSALIVQSLAQDAAASHDHLSDAFEVPSTTQAVVPPARARYFEENIPFRLFLMAARATLDDTCLAPELRPAVASALEAALFGGIPASRAADTLWWALAIDYFHSIPDASGPRLDPSGALEFRVPPFSLAKHDPISLTQRLQMVAKFLGGRQSFSSNSGGETRVLIPRLSAFEAAANAASEGSPVFGYGGRTRWIHVNGEIPRDEMNAFHMRDEVPVALPLRRIHLSHAREQVHPFPFAAHDLYHAVRVATLQAPLRAMAGGLYQAVRGLDASLRALDFVEPMLDILSDKDFQRGGSADLMEDAFFPLREQIRRERQSGVFDAAKKDLYLRFVEAVHAAWAPFIHAARREGVTHHLKKLIP